MNERAGAIDGLLVVTDELERAFEARLPEASRLAFRVAYSVLRQRQDAEDVAQEALVRAYRRIAGLRDRTRFRAWIARLTWRLALDRQRADSRRRARERAHVELTVLDGPNRDHPDPHAELWAAIDTLPEKLRLAVVLSSIEGHDVSAVAQLMGVPEGTVKSRLFTARRRLKELLS